MSDDPIFNGTSGITCETFVRAVRGKSFTTGHTDDDTWNAQYCATCFDGLALRWFETLDTKTQRNWGLLRAALLARWPPPRPDSFVSGTSIPTPAAAPPKPRRASTIPTPAAAAPATPVNSAVRVGRVRVILDDTGSPYGFLSRNRNAYGLYQVCYNAADAVVVQFSPFHLPHGVKLGFGLSDDWLGVTWGWSTAARGKLQDRWTDPKKMQSDISQGVTHWGALAAVSLPPAGSITSSSTAYSGPSYCAMWHVYLDGTMALSMEGPHPSNHNYLDSVIQSGNTYGETIQVTNDFLGFISQHSDLGWTKVRFVFEAL